MYVKIVNREDAEYGRTHYTIEMDGEVVFDCHDGEPEDNTTGRNFNSIFNIPQIIKEAHQAGIEGEPLEFNLLHKEWDDE